VKRYVAMRYLDLVDHLFANGKPLGKLDNSKLVGFLPVYDTLEDLHVENPEQQDHYIVIESNEWSVKHT
jgi:hypothetical protein